MNGVHLLDGDDKHEDGRMNITISTEAKTLLITMRGEGGGPWRSASYSTEKVNYQLPPTTREGEGGLSSE